MEPMEICITEYMLMYKMLYKQAKEVIDKTNPCRICIEDNGEITCVCGRYYEVESFCCSSCRYLSPTGCSVNSMACKMWLCDFARYNFITYHSENLPKLRNILGFVRKFNIDMLASRNSAGDILHRCDLWEIKKIA